MDLASLTLIALTGCLVVWKWKGITAFVAEFCRRMGELDDLFR